MSILLLAPRKDRAKEDNQSKPETLHDRYEELHREMVAQFERTAAAENHWLIYTLLGWEFLATCTVSHYFIEVLGWQERWPYAILWLTQIAFLVLTIEWVIGKRQLEESPFEPINKRVWFVFLFLSINVVMLNVLTGQKLFLFLPLLATLSSMAFTAITAVFSKRFMFAGLFMFATGITMASIPQYSWLIYGTSWCIILQVLSIVFYRKRHKWLT